jgi:ribosome-associated protein
VPDDVAAAADAAVAKGDGDVLVLDVGDVLAITSWFVVSSGRNPRQVKAIVEEVHAQVAERTGRKPLRIEGADSLEWVLIDYGDFVVHAFLDDVRKHYEIERLYQDVPRATWHDDDRPGVGEG